MHRDPGGFTIIEMMVVVSIIVILALIAVPNLISARLTANETAVIQTLRTIGTAQAQFRQSTKADEDGDGTGEYGGLSELSGLVGVRGGLAKVPTDLTASMRQITVGGEIEKSGYIFRMYLPNSAGEGVREAPTGGYALGIVDPDLSEVVWSCYAWPARYGVTGRRTFHTDQGGQIIFCEDPTYVGANCATIVPAAARLTPNANSITGLPAVGTRGHDGNTWRAMQ